MTTSISDPIETRLRAQAAELGFDVCGFASVVADWPQGARLAEFVAAGRHGEMAWMQTTLERRSHPRAMWPEARSAIMLGMNYGPDVDPLVALEGKSRGAISVYAQGDDYHEVIKPKLKALADLAALDDAAFRALFAKNPIKRIGRDRFVRNVLYAIGNSGDAALAGAARGLLGDPNPMVADAAAWAVGRLGVPGAPSYPRAFPPSNTFPSH